MNRDVELTAKVFPMRGHAVLSRPMGPPPRDWRLIWMPALAFGAGLLGTVLWGLHSAAFFRWVCGQ